jgi:GMP synthase-like glutamine amidotransferase
MRIHLLEHETEGISTNLIAWALKNRHSLSRTYVPGAATLPGLSDFDLLIIAGGPQHLWKKDEYPWLGQEKLLVAETAAAGKHVLGICLGAQLLADVLGGQVFTNPLEELGWHDVVLTPAGVSSPLFDHVPRQFTMFQWHSDHYTLPPGTIRLATNEAAENQAFVSADGRMLGIQFHPDFDCRTILKMVKDEDEPWPRGPLVTRREDLIQQTETRQEPAWLMDRLMENMHKAVADHV